MKPIEGASRGGVKGFLKGSYQAFSGILVKPITGLLDAASKTAEGIRYQSNLNNEQELLTRVRLPRVFYGKEMLMKSYLPLDAEVFAFLQTTEQGRYSKVNYIDTILVNPNGEGALLLVISVEKFLVVSGVNQKIMLSSNMGNIKLVTCKKDYVVFQFHKPVKHESDSSSIVDDTADMTPVARIRHKDEQFVINTKGHKINTYIQKLVVNVLNYYGIEKEL